MTEPKSCPRCYAPLRPSESPEGLCPKCLLAVAMGEDALLRSQTGEPLPAPPTPEELAPHFPQLEILSLIGRGGAGAVYRAIQRDLGRLVALKVLLLDPERDPTFGERFLREARAMARLTHPNIAAVYDAGHAGPYWFLMLELIEGQNLRQVIQSRDLKASQALDVCGQICSALEYAHGEGIVHRDIKPENVLLDGAGKIKLVDFGLAKLLGADPGSATLTRSSQAMGTWHYMAPEQMRRPLEVDHRADIYSLGVLLYELLTGDVPVGRYQPASHRSHADDRIDAIVDRALEQDPARRYQAASGVREELERVRSQPQPKAQPVAVGEPVPPKAKRPKKPRSVGSCLLIGCGSLLLMLFLFILLNLAVGVSSTESTLVEGTTPSVRTTPTQAQQVFGPYWSQDLETLLRLQHQLEADHLMVRGFSHGGDAWVQIDIAAFPEEFQAWRERMVDAVRRNRGDELAQAFADEAWWTTISGPRPRVLEIRKSASLVSGTRLTLTEPARSKELRFDATSSLGVDGILHYRTAKTQVGYAAKWQELVASGTRLAFSPAEVGVPSGTPGEALVRLQAYRKSYLGAEAAQTQFVLGENPGDVLIRIDPFPQWHQDSLTQLASDLERVFPGTAEDWLSGLNFSNLAPFGHNQRDEILVSQDGRCQMKWDGVQSEFQADQPILSSGLRPLLERAEEFHRAQERR